MSDENRIVTIIPWPGPEDKTATPAELVCPRYSDLNYWQDYGARCLALDGTMEPVNQGFELIEGCLKFYFQTGEIVNGAAAEIGNITNPHHYNDEMDLAGRVIRCRCWTENTAAELPGGGSYDPDTFQNAPVSHVWYTGDGAADGNPPAGDYWTPWANIYIYCGDLNDPTSLRCYNGSGASIFLVMAASITQVITT